MSEDEFRAAYDQALPCQARELRERNPGAADEALRGHLIEAMDGVMLQWLGEHPCCSGEESTLVCAAFPAAFAVM